MSVPKTIPRAAGSGRFTKIAKIPRPEDQPENQRSVATYFGAAHPLARRDRLRQRQSETNEQWIQRQATATSKAPTTSEGSGAGVLPTPIDTPSAKRKAFKAKASPLDAHVHPRDPAAEVYLALLADADAISYPHKEQAEFSALLAAAQDLGNKKDYKGAQEKQDASVAMEGPLRCAQAAHREASNVRHAARRYMDLSKGDRDYAQVGLWHEIVSHLDERIGAGPQSTKEKADEHRAQRVRAGNAKGGRQGRKAGGQRRDRKRRYQ